MIINDIYKDLDISDEEYQRANMFLCLGGLKATADIGAPERYIQNETTVERIKEYILRLEKKIELLEK